MIKEDYVSFDTAKHLKEKGFDEGVKSYFTDDELESYEEACEAAIKYCLENLI